MEKTRAVVAGHICLDVIPGLDHLTGQAELFQPGRLVTAGPAIFSTGGAVSNTGIALYRLGISTRLIGKVGLDPFGGIVRDLVAKVDPALSSGLVADPHEPTSYTVIISPPGRDRFFIHCPGANDAFCAQDIDLNLVAQADLFHFGYPPIMGLMYQSGGAELAEIFRRAKSTGVTTSLDLAFPDPDSSSGRADWQTILGKVLPDVDIFLPSLEEILYMLRRDTYHRLLQAAGGESILPLVTPDLLADLAGQLIDLGTKIVVIKMGDRGLFLRTADLDRLCRMGRALPPNPSAWASRELWAPCFRVKVVGTTGSGDATIAGFFSALLRGLLPIQAVNAAAAVGACNVEAADALSGIRAWDETLARIQSGWPRLSLDLANFGWTLDAESGVWFGPS